jgi:hypothetical protein
VRAILVFTILFMALMVARSYASPANCADSWKPYDFTSQTVRTSLGNEGYAAYSADSDREACRKSWTVLIYMAVEPDLAPYALWNIYEMESGFQKGKNLAGSSAHSDVIIELRREGRSRRIHLFQTPNQFNPRLSEEFFGRWTEAQIQSPVVEFPQTENLTPEERFVRFLEWGTTKYPSERYLVIYWGHGLGWTKAQPADKGDSERKFLDITELGTRLRGLVSGTLKGRPIDVFAFDACLMQTVEVASDLAGAAEFIVGSTEIQQYQGLPYRRMLYEINTKSPKGLTGTELSVLLHQISQTFAGSAKWNYVGALATRDLQDSLLPALRGLNLALQKYLGENRARVFSLHSALTGITETVGGYVEMHVLLNALAAVVAPEASSKEASTGAQLLADAIYRARTAMAKTVRNGGTRGLTVWTPQSKTDLKVRIPQVRESVFYRNTGWAEWLERVYF